MFHVIQVCQENFQIYPAKTLFFKNVLTKFAFDSLEAAIVMLDTDNTLHVLEVYKNCGCDSTYLKKLFFPAYAMKNTFFFQHDNGDNSFKNNYHYKIMAL